jgi:hypothetical protein
VGCRNERRGPLCAAAAPPLGCSAAHEFGQVLMIRTMRGKVEAACAEAERVRVEGVAHEAVIDHRYGR